MGHHRIVIEMVGGHGCDRKAGPGEKLEHCHQPTCIDCAALAFVDTVKARHPHELKATLTHWPETDGEVVDDLVTGTRVKGRFGF